MILEKEKEKNEEEEKVVFWAVGVRLGGWGVDGWVVGGGWVVISQPELRQSTLRSIFIKKIGALEKPSKSVLSLIQKTDCFGTK